MSNKPKNETLRLKAQRAALAKLNHRPITDSAKQHIERGSKR